MSKGARIRARRLAIGKVTPQVPGPTGFGAKGRSERRLRFMGKRR